MIKELNNIFKSILQNPIIEDNWSKFDLTCLLLSRNGFTFVENGTGIPYNAIQSKNLFDLKMQFDFILSNQKRALDLQLYQFLQELITYKRILNAWRTDEIPQLIIHHTDYFTRRDSNTISYYLTNVPLLNLKIESIINRRCKSSIIN
jgi:hypothetical protein